MCVCERERDRERETEGENERKYEMVGASLCTHIYTLVIMDV